jgi:hypothetical protein
MRYVLPILALLIACLPRAFGQTASKPAAAAVKPPKPAKPAPAPGTAARSNVPPALKTAYAAVPEAERTAIQSDLIWTGDYNGLVGAEFGDRAITAVKAFQKRNGGKETGVLNPDERAKLAQGAKAQQERTGWRLVEDSATGARLGIPTKMAPQSGAATSGSHWQSVHGEVQVETFRVAAPGTTLASVFEQQRKEPAERKVEYNVLRGDFFVISGLQGLKKFYVRAAARENSNGQPGSDVRGITILYDQSMEGTMDRIAVAMSSAFAAFPAPLAGAPPPRRKVEYGTGLLVSKAGDILTDAELLTDCELIAVPGLGYAERIAADPAGLALLRVNGLRDAAPLALGGGTPSGEVALVGIADPQFQNGGKAVSTARGRLIAGGDGAGHRPRAQPRLCRGRRARSRRQSDRHRHVAAGCAARRAGRGTRYGPGCSRRRAGCSSAWPGKRCRSGSRREPRPGDPRSGSGDREFPHRPDSSDGCRNRRCRAATAHDARERPGAARCSSAALRRPRL